MLLFNLLAIFLTIHQTIGDKSDVGLNPGQMIANHGYPSETHYVTTEDGYIITIYRIPHGINDDGTAKKPPVLVMHGFQACSAAFVALGPKLGLGYILADAGYDVWLGNARGTALSRNHTSIDPDANPASFFNFTWHEIGYYDVANSIDYILEVNGDQSIYYVGHSQGSTALLALTSTRPEYNSKIRFASLMAPAAIIKHYPDFFYQELGKYVDRVWSLLQKYKIYEMPFVGAIREAATRLCVDYPNDYTDSFCDYLFETEVPEVDKEMVPAVFSNCPAGAALKQYMHYAQLVRDGGFRQFDHGVEINLKIYGTEIPPDYDLSKITIPLAFYYAKNDGMITPEDEETLVRMVPNVVLNYFITVDNFVHVDFTTDNRVVDLVYNQLLSTMSNY